MTAASLLFLREVRSIFDKEVETMNRFESPNIQRVFGICIQEGEKLTCT